MSTQVRQDSSEIAEALEYVRLGVEFAREVIARDIASLPERNATGSRDFGRGYAQAIRDVLAIVEPSVGPS